MSSVAGRSAADIGPLGSDLAVHRTAAVGVARLLARSARFGRGVGGRDDGSLGGSAAGRDHVVLEVAVAEMIDEGQRQRDADRCGSGILSVAGSLGGDVPGLAGIGRQRARQAESRLGDAPGGQVGERYRHARREGKPAGSAGLGLVAGASLRLGEERQVCDRGQGCSCVHLGQRLFVDDRQGDGGTQSNGLATHVLGLGSRRVGSLGG